MFLRLFFVSFFLLALGCQKTDRQAQQIGASEHWAFTPIDTHFTPLSIYLAPLPVKYDVLFHADDSVATGAEKKFPAKADFDFMAYFPIKGSPEEGYLWVNHETDEADNNLGDGGGASILHIKRQNEIWKRIGAPKAVDFAGVGGTWNNCLGGVTPWGTVLTSEEYEPASNWEIYKQGKGIRDTAAYGGFAKFYNYGWMVEADPYTGKVLGKRWALGRFSHEGALCMPDSQTIYLLDDFAPGIFFKFIAEKKADLSKGRLFALQLGPDGKSVQWLPLPAERDSLNEIRKVALRRGASFFIRLEDIEKLPDGRFILSETGKDEVDLAWAINLGGKPAPHLSKSHKGNGKYSDYYGRLLIYDPRKETLEVFLEGGAGRNSNVHFANPDNLSVNPVQNWLVIHEDINAPSQGRVSLNAGNNLVNEIYVLDLSIKNPTIDDLQRLLIAPRGAETTGSCWNNDYSTLFINIQHPDPDNPPPFNKDMTIAVSGFGKVSNLAHKKGK